MELEWDVNVLNRAKELALSGYDFSETIPVTHVRGDQIRAELHDAEGYILCASQFYPLEWFKGNGSLLSAITVEFV